MLAAAWSIRRSGAAPCLAVLLSCRLAVLMACRLAVSQVQRQGRDLQLRRGRLLAALQRKRGPKRPPSSPAAAGGRRLSSGLQPPLPWLSPGLHEWLHPCSAQAKRLCRRCSVPARRAAQHFAGHHRPSRSIERPGQACAAIRPARLRFPVAGPHRQPASRPRPMPRQAPTRGPRQLQAQIQKFACHSLPIACGSHPTGNPLHAGSIGPAQKAKNASQGLAPTASCLGEVMLLSEKCQLTVTHM